MDTPTTAPTIRPAELPATIRAFLAAHVAGEADAAFRTFSPDAVVVDQDETFRGTEQVLDFLRNSRSEFTYHDRAPLRPARGRGPLGGGQPHRADFPGGVADLTYRFTLTANLISELTIR